MSSLRDDDVCVALARLNELEVHGLDGIGVALDHPVYVLSAFGDVPGHDPHQAVIVIGIDEDLDIHLVAQFLAGEDEDALDDDYISGLHGDGFGLGTRAGYIGIDRLVDGLAGLELRQLLAEEVPVYGVGMVEVVVALLFVSQVAGVLVVGVLRNDDDFLALDVFRDGLDHRGLA